MKKRYNIVFGGKAGQGPNFLSQIIDKVLISQGYYSFDSRVYQSLIRGGHNFNRVCFSNEPVYSSDSDIDIVVALDDKSVEVHKENLNKKGIVLKQEKGHKNVFLAGKLVKALGFDFSVLKKELKNHKKYEENLKEAKEGFDSLDKEYSFNLPEAKSKTKKEFVDGSEGISRGAFKSGLDVYFAYPMTPATPVLANLAQKQKDNNIEVLELENEIGVANAGVGCSITGAKTMVGTSGGGLDLMSETISLTGMAEVPLVFYLAQRAGPSTGVATYTSQSDLRIALNAGHGEFPRIVLAPGDPKEAMELTSHAFYFSQKYKTPSILVTDTHLAESFYVVEGKPDIKKSGKKTKLERYTSYEQNPKTGSATEDAEIVKKEQDKRIEKGEKIKEEAEGFPQYKIHGKKNSKNVVLGWGSTKGAILDAINGEDVKFVQILYLEPFPEKIKSFLEKANNVMLVENNSTGQLGDLVREKTGFKIKDKNKILKYDAREFLADELNKEIKRRLK